MKSVIVLDPGVVLGATSEEGLTRLQDWAADSRVRLGERTWSKLIDFYNGGAPGLPQSLMRISHRTFGDLLAREPLEHVKVAMAATLSAVYRGEADHHDMIVADLHGAHERGVDAALGTDVDLWDTVIGEVSLVPPPPSGVIVHMNPLLPTVEEIRAARYKWFAGRRLVIIGGQVDGVVVSALAIETGVPAESIRWIPSEKNKRARNLKSVIQGLPSNAIVVCVVGKVGHDVSGDVKEYTSSYSIKLCESRFASQIVADLKALAQ